LVTNAGCGLADDTSSGSDSDVSAPNSNSARQGLEGVADGAEPKSPQGLSPTEDVSGAEPISKPVVDVRPPVAVNVTMAEIVPREIKGYGGTIKVAALPDGAIELIIENEYSAYSTDAESPADRLTRQANGDLSYTSEHGDTITLHANNDRTTEIPNLKIVIREGFDNEGARYVREYAFQDVVSVGSRRMHGRWVRQAPGSTVWEKTHSNGNAIKVNS
jgi:hypothetical protein